MASQKQKSLLTTLVLLVAAAGIGAFAYWGVDLKQQKEAAAKEASKLLFHFARKDVTRLEVVAKGTDTVLARQGSGWKIVAPVAADADQATVSALLDKVHDLRFKKVVDEHPAAYNDYGLVPPSTRVQITLADQKRFTVELGATNGFDGSLYFRTADAPRLLLGDAAIQYALQKSLLDLRDKALVHFADTRYADVQQVAVTTPALSYTLLHGAGGDWTLTHSSGEGSGSLAAPEKADRQTVEALLSALNNQKATGIFDGVRDLSKYGLDRPRDTVTLTMGKDHAVETLLFGEVGDKAARHHYLVRQGTSTVEEIQPSVIEAIEKKLFDLEDKQVVSFNRDQVRKLDVFDPGGLQVEITRSQGKPSTPGGYAPEEFAIVKPRRAKALTWKVSSALYGLSGMRAAAFASADQEKACGLDKPSHRYVVYGDGGRVLAEVDIGGMVDGKYCVGSPGAARRYLVETYAVSNLPKSLADVEDKPQTSAQEAAGKAVKKG